VTSDFRSTKTLEEEATTSVRATTLLNKQLDLPGISVQGVSFPPADPL
jgi:hypothetical protein